MPSIEAVGWQHRPTAFFTRTLDPSLILDSFTLAIGSLAVMPVITAANVVIVMCGMAREEITHRKRTVMLVLSGIVLLCACAGLFPGKMEE